MATDNPPNIQPFVASSDTFKGTPAEGVTTISTGGEGGSGGRIASFGAVTIAEQNARALASDTPPALRTPESAAAARSGLATATAPDASAGTTTDAGAAPATDAGAGAAPTTTSTPATGTAFEGSPASAARSGGSGARGTGV